MKKIRTVFLVITICCVTGCKVSAPINALLSKSQKKCLNYNQACLAESFETYQVVRSYYNIGQTIDSIVASVSYGKERDTIFIVESCGPPVFSYHAIVWNKDNVFILTSSGSVIKQFPGENSLKLMKMIERWDKKEIMSKSHEQPLKYYGEWIESRIASRIVMRQAKCEAVESIFFSDIDWESKDIPYMLW